MPAARALSNASCRTLDQEMVRVRAMQTTICANNHGDSLIMRCVGTTSARQRCKLVNIPFPCASFSESSAYSLSYTFIFHQIINGGFSIVTLIQQLHFRRAFTRFLPRPNLSRAFFISTSFFFEKLATHFWYQSNSTRSWLLEAWFRMLTF